jgi:pimeloyl-ACP methyl ester carboxylesterase
MTPRRRLASVANDELDLQYRTVHGYRRAFRHAGRGPVLLFIHGIGDNSHTWREVLPALTGEFTVLAPDLLGHGESDKPRADYSTAAYANGMRDLLDVLNIDRVTVIGHSLGGGVAAQFAYQFPQLVERLVLVSSGGMGKDVHPMLRLAAAPGVDLVMPLITSGPVRWLLGLLRRPISTIGGVGLGADFNYVLGKYQRLGSVAARQAFLRTLKSVVDWRGQHVTMLDRAYLTRILPTLVIWGTRDSVVPSAHAEIAHQALPLSRLEMFDAAGHFPHQDDPARFLGVLRDFLHSTTPAVGNQHCWRQMLRDGPLPEPTGTELPFADEALSSGT